MTSVFWVTFMGVWQEGRWGKSSQSYILKNLRLASVGGVICWSEKKTAASKVIDLSVHKCAIYSVKQHWEIPMIFFHVPPKKHTEQQRYTRE